MARWVALLLLVVAPALAQEPDAAEIRRLIADLGDADRGVRERSSRTLLQLGSEASPFAMEALRNPDPEVRRRARAIWRVPTWAWAARWASYDPKTRLPLEVMDRGTCIRMVLIPAGTFRMGLDPKDPDRDGSEWPQHEVTLTRPFYMGRYEVTRSEWDRVMAAPGGPPVEGPSRPVADLSLAKIEEFLGRTRMRLPTEAEWEYACRAGSDGPRYGPVDEIAWHRQNSGRVLRRVGHRKPNAFGLYDMLGNAEELCADSFEAVCWFRKPLGLRIDPKTTKGGPTVVKGGSCRRCPTQIRASYRISYGMWLHETVGLRVAQDP